MKYIFLITLGLCFVGCSTSSKWYSVSCNKEISSTYYNEKAFMKHIDDVGFNCKDDKKIEIKRITDKVLLRFLNR